MAETANNFLQSLDTLVRETKSFQTIMADGVVEEHEVTEQAERVNALIAQLEQRLSEEDFKLVVNTFAEISVLNLVMQYSMLQKVNI